MFPTTGSLNMLTIATALQVPLPPTNSISMSDFGTKGIKKTWDALGNSTPIPVAQPGTSLSIQYFRGRYYRNPAIPPTTVPYTTSETLATAPIIDFSSPIRFDYTIVGGGGGGASGGGGYNGSSGNYAGGGGGGGGSGDIVTGTNIPYTSGNSVIITVGSGGTLGSGVGVNQNGNSGGNGGATSLQTGSFSASASYGNGGTYGYNGDDGYFGGRGGRGGTGGTGNDGLDGSGGGDGEFDTTLRYAGGGGGGRGGAARYVYSGTNYGGGGSGSGGGIADADVFDRYATGSGNGSPGQNGIVVITWYYN